MPEVNQRLDFVFLNNIIVKKIRKLNHERSQSFLSNFRDIHSGCLDPQLSSKYFDNYLTMYSYLFSRTKNKWAKDFCLKHCKRNLHITCS